MECIINVSETEAIKQGINQSGDIIFEYDPADLTQEQREEMALSEIKSLKNNNYLLANPGWIGNSNYRSKVKVGKADMETLRSLLDLRIRLRAEALRERQEEIEKAVSDFMSAPFSQLVRQATINATRHRDDIWKQGLDKLIPLDEEYRNTLYDIYKRALDLPPDTRNEFEGLNDRIEQVREESEKVKEEVLKLDAQRKEDWERRKKEDEEKARAAEKAAEDTRRAWVDKHGSERLKLMAEAGYEYRRTYEEERIALEFPGYSLMPEDYDRDDRANPSLEALKELRRIETLGLKASIDWVTETIKEEDDYGYETREEKYEAVVIDAPWCRKYIIKRTGAHHDDDEE